MIITSIHNELNQSDGVTFSKPVEGSDRVSF
jgi:hypothetical protein